MYQRAYNTHQSLGHIQWCLKCWLGGLVWGYINRVTLATKEKWHINALELKDVLLGLKFLIKEENIQIKVFSDSTIAIGCISKIQTSYSGTYADFTKLIWKWTEKEGIHISAGHIPGAAKLYLKI